jgi:CBS domain-containing protein
MAAPASASVLYVSRLVKLPLLDGDGATIGRVDDLVIGPPARGSAPLLLGLVANVTRRRIFVAASRIGEIEGSGIRLKTAAVDLRPFQLRVGELLTSTLLDRPVPANGSGGPGDVVLDLALCPSAYPANAWEICSVALGIRGTLRRRRIGKTVRWDDVKDLFDAGPVANEVAALRNLHPADMAKAVRRLTAARRSALTDAMEDEDLADLLEELPETDQARIIGQLETDRAAHVLEEMEPDDAADLLSELTGEQRAALLAAMHPDEADPLRRLLRYDQNTAGGLMTPEPLALPPEASVAEALARARNDEVPCALAACVFVVQPPTQTPTGTYLGGLTFQQLLREPPSTLLGNLVDGRPEPITADLGEVRVAEQLAAYNLLALPVCDHSGRLLGAVTVDDVLDRTLPTGWRSR